MASRLSILSVAVAVLVAGVPAAAATFTVNTPLDLADANPGNGVCAAAEGPCSLRAAIQESNALAGVDTIVLPAGAYFLTIQGSGENASATGDLDITGEVTIAGAGAATTIIDAAPLGDRVLDVLSGASAVIAGVTLQNGIAVTADAFTGGGANVFGTLTLTKCVVARNWANAGAGLYLAGGGSLTLNGCTISENQTVHVEITNPEGGGLRANGGTVKISGCTFTRNRTAPMGSASGGAVSSTGATIDVVNTTVSGNWARNGGGLQDDNSHVRLANVTVAGNGGGGVFHYSFDGTIPIEIRNSVVAYNPDGNCLFTTNTLTGGHNLGTDGSCGFDLTRAEAGLGALQDAGGPTWTMPLRPGSPALDAGDPAGCTAPDGSALTNDQRGSPRPQGSACDLGAFELSGSTQRAVRTIPIVLDVVSGATGARFTSELTLANRGSTTATVHLDYTAATVLGASGSGSATDTLPPGRQIVVQDALAYLRSRGIPIPVSGNQGGTLRVTWSGLSETDAAFTSARTTALARPGPGRAGLSYAGPRAEEAFEGSVTIYGLRDTPGDRTNLAILNAGTTGTISLSVLLISGDTGIGWGADTVTLDPGQWTQINAPQLLRAAGFTNAWAIVTRRLGYEPFLAYAVFNDNGTDDGSYVAAAPSVRPLGSQIVPVLVESPTFDSELVLMNPGSVPVTARLSYVQTLPVDTVAGEVTETLAPKQQKILPHALQYLRDRGVPIGARGATYVGTLRADFTFDGVVMEGFAGARTSAPTASGAYGLFTPGVSELAAATREAFVYGLRHDATVRSNLAILNTGLGSQAEPVMSLAVDVVDPASGAVSRAGVVELSPGRWTQFNGVLAGVGLTEGYVRVRKLSGSGRFVAYGVVNDGRDQTSGTNDGSYVEMVVAE